MMRNRPGWGRILVNRGNITREDLSRALESQSFPRIGHILMDSGKAVPSDVKAALAEQEKVKQQIRQKQQKTAAASLRVPADKLNQLVAPGWGTGHGPGPPEQACGRP